MTYIMEYPIQNLPLMMDFPSHENCMPVQVKLGTVIRSSSSDVSVFQTLISCLLQVANTSEYSLSTENKILVKKLSIETYIQYCLFLMWLTDSLVHSPPKYFLHKLPQVHTVCKYL